MNYKYKKINKTNQNMNYKYKYINKRYKYT